MRWLVAVAATALAAAAAPAHSHSSLGQAAAGLDGDMLTLTTGRVTRVFRWNGGHIIATELRDETAGRSWRLAGDRPETTLPGIGDLASGEGALAIERIAGDAIEPAHLLIHITARVGTVTITRRCKLFPMSPAIGCAVALKGAPPAAFAHAADDGAGMIEDAAGGAEARAFVTDRLALPGRHWRADHVRFRTATDRNDNLVERQTSLLYREDKPVVGNILFLRETGQEGGIFILKEAPAGADQLGWSGRDFLLRTGDVRIVGSGFAAEDAATGEVAAYGVVIGVGDGTETGMRLALRGHFDTVRRYLPERDSMLMSNTWGDRSRDARMNEAFLRAEIDAAAELGLTHVQLDDGWQAGLSRNSADRTGQRWEDWTAADWRPHPQRFPGGIGPLTDHARRKGIRLGLWFNPSRADDYAAWQRDADILVGYWRDHGIASVKIDGVEVATLQAERNLAAFLERIRHHTRGQLVINMDVTAGRRPGYFHRNRYGNIFLENRYTDWGNYYPHRTLRNLWSLAAYLPPQWLQAEFLNVARNVDRYAAGDPLAPMSTGQAVSFAATIVAQPLAWMELTGIGKKVVKPLQQQIAGYLAIQKKLHSEKILPVGEMPDGAAWTGFQSIAESGCSGHLILYREPLASEENPILPNVWQIDDLTFIGGQPASTQVNQNGKMVVSGLQKGQHVIWHWSNRSGQCNKSVTTR